MNSSSNGVTLLWALQSPCNLGCLYCYYGTLEDELNRSKPLGYGELSHVGQNDLSLKDTLDFAQSITPEIAKRIFIAGGEPLNWKGSLEIIKALKENGCEVIVCTNGLPLLNEKISKFLIDIKVDAISVSLDSIDFTVNDTWRPDKTLRGGSAIIKGLSNFINLKNKLNSKIKIGIYSVLSKESVGSIIKTFEELSKFSIDYYIIQPISLPKNHKYYTKLSLNEDDFDKLNYIVNSLYSKETNIILPNKEYIKLIFKTIPDESFYSAKSCFGGRDLFFIQPNGSVWDCPSSFKKSITLPENFLSILNNMAKDIFTVDRRKRNTDCHLQSKECINMWQLMAFDEILYK